MVKIKLKRNKLDEIIPHNVKLIEEAPLGLEDKVGLLLVYCGKRAFANLSCENNRVYSPEKGVYTIPYGDELSVRMEMSHVFEKLGLSFRIPQISVKKGDEGTLYEFVEAYVSQRRSYVDSMTGKYKSLWEAVLFPVADVYQRVQLRIGNWRGVVEQVSPALYKEMFEVENEKPGL